jgi:hypothetical protein
MTMRKAASRLAAAALAAAASLCLFAAQPDPSDSGEEQAKRQARSVHLRWQGLPQDANEVSGTVKIIQEQTNSYFMVLGFDGGYMGLQNLDGEHVGIFSIWDPVGNARDWKARADAVHEDFRAKVVYSAPGVFVSRFGGEGTGAKTMFGCPWKVGSPMSFRVTAEPDGPGRALFTCYVGDGKEEEKVAAISRISGAKPPSIPNVHSFVEDFWRNGKSKDLVRRAEFTNYRAKSPSADGAVAPTGAAFTADENTLKTIDAGPVPGGAFLQTGGDTKNSTVPVFTIFQL